MGNIKEINIKNRTYYIFDNKSYKNIDIYYIGYITIKDSKYVNIHSANPLYLAIGVVDGSIDVKNENK